MSERENGKFAKGVSGNPGGRPKDIAHIRELARQHTEEAIQTLAEIAHNPKSSPSARVQAANALLDRAWGKPMQYSENINQNVDVREDRMKVALEDRLEMVTSGMLQ